MSAFDPTTADKDQLEAHAMTHFGRSIDKRKKIDALRSEVQSMIDGSLQRAERATEQAAADEQARRQRVPALVRHVGNGFVFPWHPLYAGNADLDVIEWE